MMFLSARGGLYSVGFIPTLEPDSRIFVSPVGEVWRTLKSCLFVSTTCWGLLWLVCKGFTACHSSFPSCCKENHPDTKSGRDLDPDKPVCAMYCLGDVTNPTFLHAFLWFLSPDFPTFATDPRVIESVTGTL